MKIRYRSMLALLLSALAGCSSVVRQPEVQLESVRIGGIGLRGGTLYAQVKVTNPNGFDLETEAISYALQLAHPDSSGKWIDFASGTLDERVHVDDHDSTIIEVPIQFRYDDFDGAFRSILDTGTFNYRVRGDVRLSSPFGRSIPYSKTGVVSLAGIR